jgi:hypothetical protein
LPHAKDAKDAKEETLNFETSNTSPVVALQDVKSQDWVEKVYKPNIVKNPRNLCKKLGYTM